MRSNACCLDLIHFAKPHRNRLWSLEPFLRGVQVKLNWEWKTLDLPLFSLSQVFHCKARSAKFFFMQNGNRVVNVRCKGLWSNQKSNTNLPKNFVCALRSLSFQEKKSAFFPLPVFLACLPLFFPFGLAFARLHSASSKMTSSYSWHHLVKSWTMPLIMIRKNFWYEFSVFLCCFFFQLESLFSNPYYVKPQRPSVSSLYGPGGGDRKNSYEVTKSFSSL